jgi:protein SCO1/2
LKQKQLFGEDVHFVAISFDPERDDPKLLQDYAKRLKIDPSGWSILRGTEQQTKEVADQFGVFIEKQPDGTYAHSTRSLFLVDANNNIRKIYTMGDKMPTEEVLSDILQLVNNKK